MTTLPEECEPVMQPPEKRCTGEGDFHKMNKAESPGAKGLQAIHPLNGRHQGGATVLKSSIVGKQCSFFINSYKKQKKSIYLGSSASFGAVTRGKSFSYNVSRILPIAPVLADETKD